LPRSWIALTILILAGCSSPPAGTNTALEASPTGLPSQGGTLSLTWKGNSSSYTLAISAPSGTSGVSVNGHPYTQPLQLSATSASVVLPANPTLSAQTYTFTVSAGGRTLSPGNRGREAFRVLPGHSFEHLPPGGLDRADLGGKRYLRCPDDHPLDLRDHGQREPL
jgi:hypothetical protein